MNDTIRSLKIGLLTLILGLVVSAMSAWCEVEAHVVNGHPVQKVAGFGPDTYREKQDFYLFNSMAIRFFSVGAILIVVGTLQIQRTHVNERVTRLEKELESFRKQLAPAA